MTPLAVLLQLPSHAVSRRRRHHHMVIIVVVTIIVVTIIVICGLLPAAQVSDVELERWCHGACVTVEGLRTV